MSEPNQGQVPNLGSQPPIFNGTSENSNAIRAVQQSNASFSKSRDLLASEPDPNQQDAILKQILRTLKSDRTNPRFAMGIN